jgi:predicted RNA methylase
MLFKVNKYHQDLLKDWERLAVFYEAINKFNLNNNDNDYLIYDLGCGSGVLSYFASKIGKRIIAIDKDLNIIKKAKYNLKDYKNVEIIQGDVLNHEFKNKADLIICETLDTALIDEEQSLIINYALKYLKNNGTMIPSAVINLAELIHTKKHLNNVCYDENNEITLNKKNNINYNILSNSITYNEIDFYKEIDLDFKSILKFKIKVDDIVNGIKISTFTKLTDNIICGTTPMLNPPLLIPIEEKSVKKGEILNIYLEYKLGGGIETIKTYLN